MTNHHENLERHDAQEVDQEPALQVFLGNFSSVFNQFIGLLLYDNRVKVDDDVYRKKEINCIVEVHVPLDSVELVREGQVERCQNASNQEHHRDKHLPCQLESVVRVNKHEFAVLLVHFVR